MNQSKQIIGTGLSGLVGSKIVELNPDFSFYDASLARGINILDKKQLEKFFEDHSQAQTVIHLAAFTDTNAAWEQRGDKNALCYQLNVVGTENIAHFCKKYHKHLIYISTDFVFDGQKQGSYLETDIPHPIDWYGQTKLMGEQFADTIVRIAFPYCSNFPQKTDIVRKIITKLQNNETLTMFTDQIITPTFIDDIALGLRKIINKQPRGIYHLVGSSSQSPYNMAVLIAKTFGFDESLVKPSLLADYLKTPNARPYAPNLALSNQKFITEFNFVPKTLAQGLLSLLAQRQN